TVPSVQPGATTPLMFPVKFVGRDTVRAWFFGSPQYLLLDNEGRIQRVDAAQTTLKVQAVRVPSLDVKALAVAFAAAEASGHGFGAMASPRDTARATIGAATVWIDYGRPSLRGRDVWKN